MKLILVVFLYFVGNLPCGKSCFPSQGFYAISNQPSRGRRTGDFHLYTIDTSSIESEEDIHFTKAESGLARSVVETSEIRTTPDNLWGISFRVRQPKRYKGSRFGTYTFTLSSGKSLNAFIRPQTKLLDTRGVYTVTVYPKSEGSTELADSADNTIGVVWTPGCQKIRWCKGKRRNINTGPRLALTSTKDAGIYTIQRRKRGSKGWFVQIEVIAASCPSGQYVISSTCTPRVTSASCLNGGIAKDDSDSCTCPPYFNEDDCSSRTPLFVLIYGFIFIPSLTCGDLLDGSNTCKGYLFCPGELFGCKCFPGWHGNNCDKPCPDGKWGIECRLSCPSDDMHCNRFVGPEETETE